MRGVPAYGGDEARSGVVSHERGHAARPGVSGRAFERAGQALPTEIAFLAAYGMTPGVLLAAAQTARHQGVSAEAVLLGEAHMTPQAYYQALARHCGAGFVAGDAELAGTGGFAQAVHAGAAEIVTARGARWLLAPRGAAIAAIIQASRRALAAPPGFAVTTPAHLSALVQRRHRREILAMASFDLLNRHPHFSAFHARAKMPPARVATMLLVALAGLLASGLFWIGVTFACGLVFFGAIFLRLAAAAECHGPEPAPPDRLPEAALPFYTLVVPLYDEARVVAQLVTALDGLDYPKAKLDIKLVVEERDHATIAALQALALPARYDIIHAPDGKPRTKPRALNMALALARGSLLTVFDAEDMPEPQQLRLAAAHFAAAPPSLSCVQARLAIENFDESWLTRLFALEYAALFDVIDPGLARLGLPLPLGGTSNHFKTKALRQVSGWDAWNVTEDADLGLRLARCGHDVGTIASSTHEEAPVTMAAWIGQRRRWQKGWAQTIATHLHNPAQFVADLGLCRAILSAALILGMVMGPLLGPIFAVWMIYQCWFCDLMRPQTAFEICTSSLACFVFLAGLVATLWPLILGARRRKLQHLLPWLVALPAYYIIGSIAAWQGLFELCSNPFHWQKTAHGLTKKARDGASQPPGSLS